MSFCFTKTNLLLLLCTLTNSCWDTTSLWHQNKWFDTNHLEWVTIPVWSC